jgi:PPM family protein phosphatase
MDQSEVTVVRSSPTKDAKLDYETLSSRTIVDIGALSHRGKVRAQNEDSYLVARFGRSLRTLVTNLSRSEVPNLHSEIGYGMLVADGMGGAAAGEVASRKAISTLVDLAIQTPDWILDLDEGGADRVLQRMQTRFDQLREAFDACIKADPSLTGMGTTMTVALSLGDNLLIAHVGDSRAYLFTQGQLVHLTKDQTMAQVLADLGVIHPDDISRHHSRHVLTSAITAAAQKAEVELHHLRLSDGDRLLLCSDGLTDMVSDAAISAVLAQAKPATECCQELVDQALEAGGKDNVTVILAGYQIPADDERT